MLKVKLFDIQILTGTDEEFCSYYYKGHTIGAFSGWIENRDLNKIPSVSDGTARAQWKAYPATLDFIGDAVEYELKIDLTAESIQVICPDLAEPPLLYGIETWSEKGIKEKWDGFYRLIGLIDKIERLKNGE